MLGLFTRDDSTRYGQVQFPEFSYTRRTYLREIANIVDFYNHRVFAVKSNHFLVNLLNTLSIPMQYSIDRYVEVACARGPYVASSLQMTSEIQYGRIFKGDFFGPGSLEAIVYNDDYFDIYEAERQWKKINAVKVHLHPKTDMGLLLANGRLSSSGSGLSVISINVPLLAVQFRGFVQDQANKQLTDGDAGQLAMSHFIHMYVLPNMLYSQIDITLMNRLMNLFYGKPMGQQFFRHPFKIVHYENNVDNALKYALETIRDGAHRFGKMLFNIPAISCDTQLEALQLPDFAPTRQIYWSMVLSRLSYCVFLLDVMDDAGLSMNRDSINHLQRVLTRMENEKAFDRVLTHDLKQTTQQQIQRILSA